MSNPTLPCIIMRSVNVDGGDSVPLPFVCGRLRGGEDALICSPSSAMECSNSALLFCIVNGGPGCSSTPCCPT